MEKKDNTQEQFAKIGARLQTCIDTSGFSKAELVRKIDKNKGWGSYTKYERIGQSHFISEYTICTYCSGNFKRIDYEKFEALSQALNVSISYLLCKTDYPTEEHEHTAEAWKALTQIYQTTNKQIKTLLSIIDKKRMSIVFDIVNAYPDHKEKALTLKYDNQTFYILNESPEIVTPNFYDWFSDPDVLLGIEKNGIMTYYKVSDQIEISSHSGSKTSLSIDDFKKMAIDIDLSIDNTINTRLSFWFNHSGYNHENDFSHTWFEI